MAKNKDKKKKLDPIPKINRRLFKTWSLNVRGDAGNKCEVCGAERGTIQESGKPIKIDAHHLINRDITDCPLKWEKRNGIALCVSHHKFSPDESFHMNPISTMDWLQKNRPDDFAYLLANYKVRVDLHNRAILSEIEERLKANEPLNLEKLISIDTKYHNVAKKEEAEPLFQSEPAQA